MNGLSPDDSIALGGVLQLLGRFLVEEINPELLAILQQKDVCDILTKAHPACADLLSQRWTADTFEAAAVDYCSLFVLPKGINPMASAWAEKGADSESLSVSIQHMVGSIREQVELPLPTMLSGRVRICRSRT